MSRRTRATELVAQIRAALDAAGLTGVIATADPGDIGSAYSNGLVLVNAPRLTFTTWDETEEVWTLHVAAGPWDNQLAAWDVLDAILLALSAGQINMNTADPTTIQFIAGEPGLPGFVIELNPDQVSEEENNNG